MDKRGVKSEVQANREHSFMSAVYSWAYQNGKVEINPCKGVSKFTEYHRERYIEHWEYDSVLTAAMTKWILCAAAMEISYCCAARQSDVWNLERNQLRKEGIFIQQGKTGAKQIKLWNPRLRAAVDLALSVSKVTSFKYVFCDIKGNHPAQGTLRNWYGQAKAEAKLNHDGDWVNDFTFHDIKAKSMSDYDSDYDGNLQKFSGHKTEAQAQSYSRKTKLSPTLK
jgi:integrase|tara:strand:- start:141 stop:812 length:672 start_codon:yes stop_codon:yes gene_type:complete